jgi:hypothetical protein
MAEPLTCPLREDDVRVRRRIGREVFEPEREHFVARLVPEDAHQRLVAIERTAVERRAKDTGEVAIEELTIAPLRGLGGAPTVLRLREQPRVVDGHRRLCHEAPQQLLLVLAQRDRRPSTEREHGEETVLRQHRHAVEALEIMRATPLE